MSSNRENRLGAGYDYQWDVAVYLLLVYALRGDRRQLWTDQDFEWLGDVREVHLEGSGSGDAIEDLTFFGATGARKLHIQVKTRADDGTRWKKGEAEIIEILNRAAAYAQDVERRFVFLSHASYDPSLTKLLEDANALRTYRDAVAAKHFKDAPEKLRMADEYAYLSNNICFRPFLAPTELGDDRHVAHGIAFASMAVLFEIGARKVEDAYRDLYLYVKNASIQKGGMRLSAADLRATILGVLGLGETGITRRRHIVTLQELLDAPQRRGQLTSDDLRTGRYFRDDALLSDAERKLDAHSLLAVIGPRASGKTGFVDVLAYRLLHAGDLPVVWDFETMGTRLPVSTAEYLSDVMSAAEVFGARPLLILENAHISPSPVKSVLALAGRYDAMRVIVTARNEEALDLELGEAARSLVAARIVLGERESAPGWKMLDWWLSAIRNLPPDDVRRVRASVPWSDYVYDLVVLRLALESYDWEMRSLPAWAIHEGLRESLRMNIRRCANTDELLYVAAALGRSGVATDLGAVAQMLAWSEERTREVAGHLANDGLLAFDVSRRTVRFWHESLAQLHWELFQLYTGEFAPRVRRSLGERLA